MSLSKKITNFIKNEIEKHSVEEYPNECCGFLIDGEKSICIFRCNNVIEGEDKKNNFAIDGKDYLKASRSGEILAVYHSHDSDFFSDTDKKNSIHNKIPYVVFSRQSKKISIFDPFVEKQEIIEQPFLLGQRDCYTLVRDHYKNKLNIELENFLRGEGWDKKNPNLMLECAEKQKMDIIFDISSIEELKKNDILVIGWKHLCIYLGDGLIIHRKRNRNSEIESLTQARMRRLSFVARNKNEY